MASAPPRKLDVDFADVFGGPPRRSSGNEQRPRRSSLDSSSFGSLPRSQSSEQAEAPVFGDRGSSDRRRQLGEEFYRDIFPGNEAASPRTGAAVDWGDVFGAPASTALRRPSFSMRLNRVTDSSLPTSPSRQTSNRTDDGTSYAHSIPDSPNSSMNNSLRPGTPQQDSRKSPFSWHRYPFLSRFRSQSREKKNASTSSAEGTPISLETIMGSNNFHFSFYKWAGKGALLVLPDTTQKPGGIIGLRSIPQVIVHGVHLIDEEDSMSTGTGASKSQADYEDSKSRTGKHSTNLTTKEGAMPLFLDDHEQGGKHSTDYEKIDTSSASPSAKSFRSTSGEKSRGRRVKERVKGFMKIFSPEGSPRRKGAPDTQNQTSIGRNGSKTELQDKFSLSNSEVNEDAKTTQMNNQSVFITASYPVNEVQERKEKPVLAENAKMEIKTDTTSGGNEAVSNESISGHTNDQMDNTIDHEEKHVEDLDGCVIEHFLEDPVVHHDQEKEQIKISESKIREWSRGKEGNIRSLLSTLQCVLWPESGWKPIPLAEIIEGMAVKKAYQKALLFLHPDKLQQRGASMHQKYIAEKVFDILQESWKEFSSVTFG